MAAETMSGLLAIGTGVLQAAILLTILEGGRRRNPSVIVNGIVAFGIALVPTLISHGIGMTPGTSLQIPPELPFWIAMAGLLHMFGMLGLYDSTTWWWWDHLTHLISGMLVAAFIYAGLIVTSRPPSGPDFSPIGIIGLTIGGTLAVGVFWEFIEVGARVFAERFDIDPVLIQYGWRDTILDLVFDLLGAIIVVFIDLQLFVPLVDQISRSGWLLLVSGTGVIVVGSVALVVGLRVV